MNSIEELSIIALGQRLFKVFELLNQPIECPTNDRLWLAQRQAQLKGDHAKLPILAYSLSSVGPAPMMPNPTPWMSRPMATTEQDDTLGSLRVLPVQLIFGVTYLDTDRVRLLRFMSNWMLAAATGKLNFRLRVDGIPVDIQVKPEESLSSPQKDITLDAPNLYEVSGNLAMTTFISGEFDSAIVKVRKITDYAVAAGVPAAMPDDLPDGSTPQSLLARQQALVNSTVSLENPLFEVITKVGDTDG